MLAPKILIVEDEAVIALELESRLLQLGYSVVGLVASGEMALVKVQENKPDVILMDIRLSGLQDGIETAKAIRKEFGLPVVFVTANSDNGTILRAREAEPVGFLTKPFRDRDLHAAIEVGLFKHRSELTFRQLNAELEKQAQEHTAKLEAMSRRMASFNDQFSNDLLAHLKTITESSSSLLQNHGGQLNASVRELVNKIRQSAKYMTDILDSPGGESGKVK